MVNLINPIGTISAKNQDELITNGDFCRWSQGDSIVCTGATTDFADGWFGRRGSFVDNLMVNKTILPEANGMRIARVEGDRQTNEWAIAQIIELKNFPHLIGKPLFFSLKMRAGGGFSSIEGRVRISLSVSFDATLPSYNPFNLSKNAQNIAVLPIKLNQQWGQPMLSAKIPEGSKYMMVQIVSNKLQQVPATKDDFVELAQVKLSCDRYNTPIVVNDNATTIPIFHVASMARSGETVFLRSLAAHPRICNLVNVETEENTNKQQLFYYLQRYRHSQISTTHPLVQKLGLNGQQVILIKQGTWEHSYPFQGVVLVRNPISVYASLISFNIKGNLAQLSQRKQNGNSSKNFLRWLGDIDSSLIDYVRDLKYLEQFCTLYNRRMYPLSQLGLPIVHYEAFCHNPEFYLKSILNYFSLKYDRSVLNSHHNYQKHQTGHGLIDLSAPINTASLHKWKKYVSLPEFKRIAALTCNTWQAFGYQLDPQEITVSNPQRYFNL